MCSMTSLLHFHLWGKVALRQKSSRKAICLSMLYVAIISIESEGYSMRTEKKEINIHIGKRLQTARENSGYTQETFAEALDVGVEHYRKIENGVYGLAAAKEIRKMDSKALIVFLTSYSKYMPDVFEVVPFDFIPKPITEDRLRLLFIKAETYLNMTSQHFSFSYRRSRFSLKLDEIFYLEKRGRQVAIHTKEKVYQSNMTLNEIWEKLDERSFAAVHGSFIVNLKHIKTFSGGVVILTDGTELTVSRGYRKQLAEKHIAFVQGGM